MAKAKAPIEDVLLRPKLDRRKLAHVPDPTRQRSGVDRRDNKQADESRPQYATFAGQRYIVSLPVKIRAGGKRIAAHCEDISQTGMLVRIKKEDMERFRKDQHVKLRFHLEEGILHEGTEKRYRMGATVVRVAEDTECIALQFDTTLYENRKRVVDTSLFALAAFCLACVTVMIVLLRSESILYFRTNALLYGYSIVTATFLLTRYLFGMLYKPVPVDPDYTPSVTIVIPCFNEEEWISRTILSCIDQDYPPEKLEFVIVDDGSSDRSVEVIQQTVNELCQEGKRFNLQSRIRCFFQKENQGKREAMGLGIRNARTELIAFVDSDSFLEPDAIRQLVQPMKDPKMGGVAGRTDVANTYTNNLTKLQSVRYYVSFRIMKAAEAYFDSVMCLSGPLSCYRLEYVREVFDKWLNQTFMGQKATFGDDRSLTNYIVEHHRTYYQDTSICSTIVPNRHKVFLKQQMRWKRSWLRESLKAGRFMWKKEPLMSIFFYFGLLIPLIAPFIVIFNLVYIPLTLKVFPTTFLLGLLMMALMMSFAQLILKKSSLWAHGLLFCMYYEFVLLWQMPWAWITFWVSDWGTRGNKKKKAKKKTKETTISG
ncbi:MAG: glycosyltransferase [Clostridia bacterium]|nr:glycosyltransferase [Clostridia bacterium]